MNQSGKITSKKLLGLLLAIAAGIYIYKNIPKQEAPKAPVEVEVKK